ncbi:unnamed protein product [Paramecium sonneborni]|uniref:Uncharacterized protein n=1 Tax=Paramecium sonneborni TaxID=65129 RepID=A0A8S1KVC6_9CILI|nr:unnamed protein product [Paramecium sonneborni]
MKGWQNFKIICQKVNCEEKELLKIDEFENNPYIIGNKQYEDGFIQYQIPYQECVSLNDLYDAIKSQYVVIFKAQAILIIQAILQHLFKMAEKKLCHCQLNLYNIFIKLKNESNQFTTYQSIIEIDKIYFVQYLSISKTLNEEDENICMDVKAIKKIIKQFLELYQDERIQKLLENLKKVSNINNKKQFKDMIEIVNQFIKDFVDISKQTITKKKNEDKEKNEDKQQKEKKEDAEKKKKKEDKVKKEKIDEEIEDYNKYQKQRYFCEKELLIQLDEILKLNIQFEENIVQPTEQEIQQQKNYKEQTLKIQQYFLSYFQPLFVKQFQQYYGDKLQNSYLITGITKNQYYELLKKYIEKERQRANRAFESIDKTIKECLTQSKLIKEKLLQDFKFQIDDIPQDQIFEIFLKFFIKNSLELHLQKQITNKVQDQSKQESFTANSLSQDVIEIQDEEQFKVYDLSKEGSYKEVNQKVQDDVIKFIIDHYELEQSLRCLQLNEELL